jgi:hypothetical protein
VSQPPTGDHPAASAEERRTLRRAKAVASQTLDGEAVLLHLASGTYFTLNETGTLVWDLLDRERTPAELLDAMIDAFEVERETARQDLAQLLDALVERGLIDVVGSPA